MGSFPSPEKFYFCTDKIESIEQLDLVQRLRIDDCFEIHLPLVEDFVICCFQVTELFSARNTASPVHLLQGALVILVRIHRNFDLLGCVCQYCTSLTLVPLS